LQLREQVVAFAVLAREMRQGRHRRAEAGQGVEGRHVQWAANAITDGHRHRPATQVPAGHDRLHGGEAFRRRLGDELHDADEGFFVQRRFQQAHGSGTELGQGGIVRQMVERVMSACVGRCSEQDILTLCSGVLAGFCVDTVLTLTSREHE
jgi:hypothetical protein